MAGAALGGARSPILNVADAPGRRRSTLRKLTFDFLAHLAVAGVLAVALTAVVWAIDLAEPSPEPPPETAPVSTLAAQASPAASASVTPVSVAPAPTTHVVRPGDTLRALAARFLGDENRWTEIHELNPDVDPESLPIGTELRIPVP
jgi:nucleoid-associated protein YgaU